MELVQLRIGTVAQGYAHRDYIFFIDTQILCKKVEVLHQFIGWHETDTEIPCAEHQSIAEGSQVIHRSGSGVLVNRQIGNGRGIEEIGIHLGESG